MQPIPMQSNACVCSVGESGEGGSAITVIRKRPALWLTAVGVMLLCVLASPAMATDYTWVASGDPLEASGNWSDASHWAPLGGPPGPGDTATINLDWTEDYTVTLNVNVTVDGFTLDSDDAEFYASSRTFTVDGPSQLSTGSVWWRGSTWTGTGTITNNTDMTIRNSSTISSTFIQNGNVLVQGGGGTSHALLTTATGFTNSGTITLETLDGGYYSNLTVTDGAPLINNGTINVNGGGGGARTIAASLTNNNDVNLNTPTTFLKASGAYTNNNSFNIAPAGSLTISGSSQTFTQAGGTLAIDGAFNMHSSTTFNFDAGTITGYPIVDDSTLNIGTGSIGSGFFTMRGNSTLSGDIAAAQTIWIQGSSAGSHATLTAATGFTNSGTITLETLDGGYQSNLIVTEGTLTNAATGVIDVNEGSGGPRTIAAGLTNNNEVNLNTATIFSKANGVYTNNSAFNIAPAGTLTISGSSQTFTQAGGTLAIAGAFKMSGNTTLNFYDGVITGYPIVDDSTLNIGTGSIGSAFFTMRGNSTLSGDIAAAQTIWIQGSGAGSHATLTAANGFTNSGTITLESINGGYNSNLTVTDGEPLINDGVFNVNEGSTGARTIAATLTNNNDVNLNTATIFSKANGVYTNNSSFNIAPAGSLTIGGSSQTFTQAGGTLAIAGAFKMSGNTTLNFDDGTITGYPIVDDSTLNIGTGSIGSGFFTMQGNSTLSGDIAAAQTIWIQGSGAGSHAALTAATGFTNSGTITLESINGEYNSNLTVAEGTLTNAATGVINVNEGSGGPRTISLELVNHGEVAFRRSSTLGRVGAAHVNYGDLVSTKDGVVVSLTGDTFANDSAGTLRLALGGVDQYILNITGTANLAGTLELSVIDCEHPYIGRTFEVLTAATAMSGTFDMVTGLESYDATYDNGPPGTVIVEVTGVPVPGDLNGDTFVDMLDVPLFVETLLDPLDEYTHLCYLADIDGSGGVDGLDIQPFLLLLMP